MRRSCLCLSLSLLSVVLLGIILVLSTVVVYFGVDQRDVITEVEMRHYEHVAAQERGHFVSPNEQLASTVVEEVAEETEGIRAERGDSLRKREFNSIQKIPKIVHQTWKENVLPEKWDKVRNECMAFHPDYEYKLWSDESSLSFIATEYPWFLDTFKGYSYPIQRADSIRYFVLHHFGGIYMDLDVGCKRAIDPLLYYDVILPATIPVGVSNDVMLAEKGHPFLDFVIHSLISFDHQYTTNYPTVMFSTGPMFLSAVYGMWPRIDGKQKEVRILPRKWYGKNAPINERQEAFFEHFYGSSWHSNDAGFITFLGKFGMLLMYAAVVLIIIGTIRLVLSKAPLAAPILVPALHFHIRKEGLPFTRPASPNSQQASPAFLSRDSPLVSRGLFSQLPDWFNMPSDILPQHSRPSSPTLFRYGEMKQDNRYQSVPSRPPSPVPITRESSMEGSRLQHVSRKSPPLEAFSSLLSAPPLPPIRMPPIPRRRTSPDPSPPTSPNIDASNFYQPLLQPPSLLAPEEDDSPLPKWIRPLQSIPPIPIVPPPHYRLRKNKIQIGNDNWEDDVCDGKAEGANKKPGG